MGEPQGVDESLHLLLIGIVGMFLLAASVIAFFIVYQKRLFAQQDHIHDLERAYEEDLLKSAVTAQERERRRIATDLHDGLGSLLSTIRLYVMQFTMSKSPEATRELAGATKSVIDTAIHQTREISHDLLPTTLSRFGAVRAIEDFCGRFQRLQDIEVKFTAQSQYQFTEQQDLALYRIVQELVNNTLKHAGASCINIQLHSKEGRLCLSYEDDGCGCELDTNNLPTSGLGMKSIESRVRVLNGAMELQSAPGRGFRFTVAMEG